MQEEILIKKYRSGTTIHFFNTDIHPNNFETSTSPAIVKLNSSDNVPMELNAWDGVSLTGINSSVLWKRNQEQDLNTSEIRMNFVHDTFLPNPNYISGRTFSQVINFPQSKIGINAIVDKFIQNMNEKFTAGTTSFVFVEDTPIDDLHVNIKLERSFDFLNTLSIYNKVTGENTYRESNTGVVFGKLEAIQKISDSNGNRLRIPLRNVPIGIFQPSDEFQTPNELDGEGNRIRLNFRPLNTDESDYPVNYKNNYFNEESASFDNTFLKNAPLEGINIHPTFKNVVYTNENGEFILHNINVGAQILFFEVDLLKQGLTKDEVALNYFPYPPNYDNISIDTIPHYFYRAIPIDVVPAWGTSYQTGYTEVNVSVNLDLRKWATYIIPPVSYKGYKMDDEKYYEYFSRAPLVVEVRDMSKFDESKLNSSDEKERLETYPSKRIQMVQIPNVLEKNYDQQWEWANEYSLIKDKAIFFSYGFNAIKLPANIYDDESYRTDKFGVEQDSKYSRGVWLCGYQIKVSLTSEDELYRTTGMALTPWSGNGSNWFTRDHFHCSLYDSIDVLKDSPYAKNSYEAKGEGLLKFPYERAWTKNYPERYKIPKLPEDLRYNNFYTEHLHLESPEFSDGEIIHGFSWLDYENGNGWNGLGLSWFSLTEQYTDFSTDIIGGAQDSKMYKYETIGAFPFGTNQYFGCYANGFYDGLGGENSNVLNGENFQRIEAGYGYFLYPSSMPRIVPTPSGLFGYLASEVDTSEDYSFANNQKKGLLTSSDISMSGWWNLIAQNDHYSSYSVFMNSKSISMDLSKKQHPKSLINDRLNIYRIVDGKNRIPYGTQQPTIPTYTQFVIEKMMFTDNQDVNDIMNLTEISFAPWVKRYYETSSNVFSDNSYVWLEIENAGDVKSKLEIWENEDYSNVQSYELVPGEKVRYHAGINIGIDDKPALFNNFIIKAWGNSDYDENTNKYLKTKLKFTTSADWNGYQHGQRVNNMHIRKDCSDVICSFDALDTIKSSNTWYADTVWKVIDIRYYDRNTSNGYPKNNNERNYDNEYANIQGMFYNPGYYNQMSESSNGTTFSSCNLPGYEPTENCITNRLKKGGSLAFYWCQKSYKPRYNPNDPDNSSGLNFTPLMSIGYQTNFGEDYWSTPACCMRTAGQSSC